MPDDIQIYQSELTGPELDEALRNIGSVQQAAQSAAQSAATAQQYGSIVQQNQDAIQDIADNLTAVQGAAGNAQAAQTAAAAAAASETAARQYAEQAQQVSQGAVGYYETGVALEAAHPTGQAGNWAIVGDTDTIWVWDTETGAWLDTSQNVNLSDYYTKSQADARYATAAQGEMAQAAVQTVNGKTGKTVTLSAQDVGAAAANAVFHYVIAAGMGAVLDKENQDLNLLLVDVNHADSANNRPFIFGVEDISRLTNSPYAGGPFYGYRYVIFSGHLVTVVIVEQYPVGGRTWGNTYDHNISQWYGWRGTQM